MDRRLQGTKAEVDSAQAQLAALQMEICAIKTVPEAHKETEAQQVLR